MAKQPTMSDSTDFGSTLLVALYIPGAMATDDPDQTADDLVAAINATLKDHRQVIEVGGIPAPQWLTPSTLANLRAAARWGKA